MNDRDQETEVWRSPLIFTVPAYGFVMALYLDWLGQPNQVVKTRRLLSNDSNENGESFRGKGHERRRGVG
jgi:hypothetical protein